MITASQLRAARAFLGLDQRELAELAGLSLPTIQRMEASEGLIRGNVDSLTRLVSALDKAGVELIGEGAASQARGRGVRLKGIEVKMRSGGMTVRRSPRLASSRAR
jgi:transcriptional regulator with XRE-family HTH domain